MSESTDFENIKTAERTQTMEETDRKCPQCGGTMDFDPETGGLHCPYCDYKEEIREVPQEPEKAKELDFSTAEQTGNCDWGMNQKTVICKSCGAQSVYDALEIASVCPYCGSNQVMEANDVSTLAPGGVVAFKITAKQAGSAFYKWIKRKWFCPRAAKESAKAEAFQGIYLPYWTFDADTTTNYTAEYGINREVRRGQETKTVTDWHRTSGVFVQFINDQLVSGTTNHEESTLRRIEPYDTEDNKAYKPEYIAGFAAERYSLGLKDAWEKARDFIKSRLEALIENKISDEHHADEVKNVVMDTAYRNITYKYLMLPVWISSFTYKGKVYQFMVNGQSGKVGGHSPISAIRVAVAVLIGLAAVALICWLSN